MQIFLWYKAIENNITQVRISVGCQRWTIGPRLALLWRLRFGDHNWANCGSFGFTNFGSQHWQPKMCPTVGSTMAQTRTYCRANFGELLQMTVTVQSAHLWATVEPIVGILRKRFRCHCTTNCRPNYGPDSNRLSGQPWRITLDDRDSLIGPLLGHG